MSEEEAGEQLEAPEVDAVTKLAVEMGYNPSWNGPEDQKKTPDEYILNTNKALRQASSDVGELKNQVSGMSKTMEEFTANQAKQLKQALDSQRKRLEEERSQAVAEGDTEAFHKLDSELKTLEPTIPTAPAVNARQQAIEAAERAFEQKHAWYNGKDIDSVVMTSDAVNLAISLGRSNPDLPADELFKQLEQGMQIKYPEKFASPSNKPTLLSPNTTPPSKPDSVWSQMLQEYPEAKDVFADAVSKGQFEDTAAGKEKYAKLVMEN